MLHNLLHVLAKKPYAGKVHIKYNKGHMMNNIMHISIQCDVHESVHHDTTMKITNKMHLLTYSSSRVLLEKLTSKLCS